MQWSVIFVEKNIHNNSKSMYILTSYIFTLIICPLKKMYSCLDDNFKISFNFFV